MMQLLLLCVWLTLVWSQPPGLHHVVKSNFELPKVSGDWYSILIASDVMVELQENGALRIFVENIDYSDNNCVLKYQRKENGQCVGFSFVANKTAQDGVYGGTYDGYNEFEILEVDYDDYVVFHTVHSDHGKKSHILELFGRGTDVRNPEIKTLFRVHCQKYGIPPENTVDLRKVDRCIQTRRSK